MKKITYLMMAAAIALGTFTACEDVPEPYVNPYAQNSGNEPEDVTIDPAGEGTEASPWNVAALLQACEGLGADEFLKGGEDVVVTGLVVETTEVSTQYGNATYYIADNARGTNRFYVFRGKLLDNAAVANENDLEVGDSVVVKGKVKNYKGNTLEFDQGNYLLALVKNVANIDNGGGGTDTPAQPGTAEAPLTVAQALDYIAALGTETSPEGYVKGIITKIDEVDTGSFGNATYYISDDATAANQLEVYRGYYLEKAKFTSVSQIKVGDEVVVCGKLVNFRSTTPEVTQGSYIYSLNGQTGAGGGGTDTPAADVQTVTIAEFNAAPESTTVWYQLTGTVKNLKSGDLYGNFDLEDATGSVYVYGLLSEKGGAKKLFQDLVAAKGITEGCTLTLIGNRGSYNDKIEVVNAYFVSIGGGNDNPGGGTDNPAVEVPETGDNGDFEAWVDGLPLSWKTASTAGNATLSQSTDAHGGRYSVCVAGNTNTNKRLGYQEIQLAAGTYTVTFYAKALAEGGSLNPGIVPVTNGSVGSYSYAGYVDNISTTSWQKVEATLSVATAGTYCFVIMNQKKATGAVDILIDDYTVTIGDKVVIQ